MSLQIEVRSSGPGPRTMAWMVQEKWPKDGVAIVIRKTEGRT